MFFLFTAGPSTSTGSGGAQQTASSGGRRKRPPPPPLDSPDEGDEAVVVVPNAEVDFGEDPHVSGYESGDEDGDGTPCKRQRVSITLYSHVP